jgi:hypothetical protein
MAGSARCARGLETLSLLHISRTRSTSSKRSFRNGRSAVRGRRYVAHSAVADGPQAGLQPLKWEPGAERPAFAGLPAGASSAGALDEGDVGAHAEQRDKPQSVPWSSIAAVGDLPTVAPATGAPAGSPAKAGRSVPGSHFSGCRPACGPTATAEWAASQRRPSGVPAASRRRLGGVPCASRNAHCTSGCGAFRTLSRCVEAIGFSTRGGGAPRADNVISRVNETQRHCDEGRPPK